MDVVVGGGWAVGWGKKNGLVCAGVCWVEYSTFLFTSSRFSGWSKYVVEGNGRRTAVLEGLGSFQTKGAKIADLLQRMYLN